ncbi:coatomer WD associated region-domain-containing protein [Boletus reticuloceps]|uniref:Coatomer WD associated region-domain-containing protein n=1 Tax=Boletus reticuloceps TaxID=495285 RepID=A0A8I2YE71_9AGAM|nr:coatomer WD associated region-domain-containing protein [Boletus reticuloceps]
MANTSYTALAWRNKSFGNGLSFAWAGDSNMYAVLESKLKERVCENFKERDGAAMKGSGSWSINGLHGGSLLGAQGQGFMVFWDWESGEIVGWVYWFGTGSLVAITSEDSSYILCFNRDAHNTKLEEGVEVMGEGVEEAFDIVSEVSDKLKGASVVDPWVGMRLLATAEGPTLSIVFGIDRLGREVPRSFLFNRLVCCNQVPNIFSMLFVVSCS